MFSHSKESYTHGKDWADNLLPTPDSFLVCMYVCNVTNGFTFQTETFHSSLSFTCDINYMPNTLESMSKISPYPQHLSQDIEQQYLGTCSAPCKRNQGRKHVYLLHDCISRVSHSTWHRMAFSISFFMTKRTHLIVGITLIGFLYFIGWTSQMMPVVKNPPANAGDIREAGSIAGSRRSPGRGHGNSLQYSWLENPMDRGAWWATVHRVTKSQTWLKWLSMHTRILYGESYE